MMDMCGGGLGVSRGAASNPVFIGVAALEMPSGFSQWVGSAMVCLVHTLDLRGAWDPGVRGWLTHRVGAAHGLHVDKAIHARSLRSRQAPRGSGPQVKAKSAA